GVGRVLLGRSAGGRRVAVKVIRPELAGEPGFRARFEREVAAARTVCGLFTAPVADADVQGQVPWLATAYVPGPSLADAVDAQGPLPVDSVLTLAAGVAGGLGGVHAAGGGGPGAQAPATRRARGGAPGGGLSVSPARRGGE